jgi:hypothetical protein
MIKSEGWEVDLRNSTYKCVNQELGKEVTVETKAHSMQRPKTFNFKPQRQRLLWYWYSEGGTNVNERIRNSSGPPGRGVHRE